MHQSCVYECFVPNLPACGDLRVDSTRPLMNQLLSVTHPEEEEEGGREGETRVRIWLLSSVVVADSQQSQTTPEQSPHVSSPPTKTRTHLYFSKPSPLSVEYRSMKRMKRSHSNCDRIIYLASMI